MKTSRIINLSRPRFWLYELGAYVVGLAAAYTTTGLAAQVALRTTPSITIALVIFFIYFAFPANLLIYGINDIYDYETDIRNPKKTGYEDVLQPSQQKTVWKWIIFTNTPFLLGLLIFPKFFGIVSAGSAIMWLFIAFIFFASSYSAYPIRAKIRPVLDSFFSAAHYIATAVFGFCLAIGLISTVVDGSVVPSITISIWSYINWWYVVAGICWAMAMHAYSAVPDIQADAESGIQTIATKLGERTTIALCFFLYAGASIIVFQYEHILRNALIALLSVPYLYIMMRSYNVVKISDTALKDQKLFKLYKYFPILNACVGFLLFWIIALSR